MRVLPPARKRKEPRGPGRDATRSEPPGHRGTPGLFLPPAERPHVRRSTPARGGGTPPRARTSLDSASTGSVRLEKMSVSTQATFETGHTDQIHDCQYDYYGRVRAI